MDRPTGLPSDPRQYIPGHVSQHFARSIMASFTDRGKAQQAALELAKAGYADVQVAKITDHPMDRADLRQKPYPRVYLQESLSNAKEIPNPREGQTVARDIDEAVVGRFVYLLTVPLGDRDEEQAKQIILRHGGDLDAHTP